MRQKIKNVETMRTIYLMIAACVLGACSGGRQEKMLVRSVYTVVPMESGTETTKQYTGRVEEAHHINLGFKTAGQLTRILVEEGDYVHEGELLAELDTVDYRLAVDALQIQYEQLKDEVARTKQLFEERSVSANDYEKATAGLQQLAIQLQANQNKLAYTKLYAPADGYIEAVNFSPAEMVDAGRAVFELLDVSHMEVTADIPASLYLQRDRFTGFECTSAYAGKHPLRLLGITPKADGSQLYRMRLGFDGQTDARLTAGMNVEIAVHLADSAREGMTLPLSTLCRQGENTYVWVVNADTTVSKRQVTLLHTDAEERAVVSGVRENEQVVRAGVNYLREGDKVRVIAAPSQTNVGGLL